MSDQTFFICILVFGVACTLLAIYDTRNLLKDRREARKLNRELTAEAKCTCDTPCNPHCEANESKFN